MAALHPQSVKMSSAPNQLGESTAPSQTGTTTQATVTLAAAAVAQANVNVLNRMEELLDILAHPNSQDRVELARGLLDFSKSARSEAIAEHERAVAGLAEEITMPVPVATTLSSTAAAANSVNLTKSSFLFITCLLLVAII